MILRIFRFKDPLCDLHSSSRQCRLATEESAGSPWGLDEILQFEPASSFSKNISIFLISESILSQYSRMCNTQRCLYSLFRKRMLIALWGYITVWFRVDTCLSLFRTHVFERVIHYKCIWNEGMCICGGTDTNK